MLKAPSIGVGVSCDSGELNLAESTMLLVADVPPVVFRDDQITKMHDSLPITLFRFETLLTLYEHHKSERVAYFLPWVRLNEAMSRKGVETGERLNWIRMVYCFLMKCMMCYRDPIFIRVIDSSDVI
jgi:hypothetical protein